MTQMTRAYEWHGRDLVDRHGDKVGTVEELYVDELTDEPEWAAVRTDLLGQKLSFVPIQEAQPSGEQVRVPFDKDQVKDAPRIDPEEELSPQEEATLYAHYGMTYSERGSHNRRPEAPRTPVAQERTGPATDDAMTRSEEELRVAAARRERGRARLRKYVVTEHVQKTVPVRREEVRLEREPITEENVDQALSGPEITEQEHEVVLHEEVPVVEKRVVPKERIRLRKETVTEEAEVSEEVRKEQIEAGTDNPSARRRRG
jgi:uncharacterized protein (TIGR02271 family)